MSLSFSLSHHLCHSLSFSLSPPKPLYPATCLSQHTSLTLQLVSRNTPLSLSLSLSLSFFLTPPPQSPQTQTHRQRHTHCPPRPPHTRESRVPLGVKQSTRQGQGGGGPLAAAETVGRGSGRCCLRTALQSCAPVCRLPCVCLV